MGASTGTAWLGMYPFQSLVGHWTLLWSAIRQRLGEGPDELSWSGDARACWTAPDLVLGMTCGWPLVTELIDVVDVVGAFDVSVPFAADGRYRSVLVASKPRSLAEWRSVGDVVVAVNGRDSLSGWVSMCHAWGDAPERVMVTGAHVESLRAVVSGAAHVASIDAVTFEHAVAAEPNLGAVHVVGHGPLVPSLPLVTAAGRVPVTHLRSAIGEALADPSLGPTLAALRVRGFVPLDLSDYRGLSALMR